MRYLLSLLLLLGLLYSCDDNSTGSDETDGDNLPPNSCASDEDCAVGYYCDLDIEQCRAFGNGTPCTDDNDCPQGYVCASDGSCEVETTPPADGDKEAESTSDGDLADGDLIDGDQIDGDLIDGDLVDGDEPVVDGDTDLPVRCDDHLPCTEDEYNGVQCVFTLLSGYCLIDDVCDSDGQLKPQFQCSACRSDLVTDAWSNAQDDLPCEDGLVCTTNDRCQQGACLGDTVSCDDSVDCTTDRCTEPSGCQFVPDDSTCPEGYTCDPDEDCTAIPCTENDARCVDNEERQICDENGVWQTDQICSAPTPVCTEAGCVACQQGAKRCEGNQALVCNTQGQWESETCLGPDPACQQGECVPCTDDDLWCGHTGDEDWALYRCNNGEWQIEEDCEGDTPMCGELDGVLQCLECPPGSYRCDGLSHQVCDEYGIWQIDPCPTNRPYCESGQCVVCLLGDTRCGDVEQSENANDVYTCEGGELSNHWELQGPCPSETPSCSDGVCEACIPGDTRCADDPGQTEICNDDGLWEAGEACEGGYFCDPETGECGEGYSLYFDGESRMEIPDNNEYDPNAEFTLEAWIFPLSLSGNCDSSGNTVLEKWDAWPIGTYMLAVCSDFYGRPNVARFYAYVDDGVQDYFHSSNNAIDIGEWNHVAVVWADDRMDMFVNGVREHHQLNYIGWKTPNTYQQNVLAVGRLNQRLGWGFHGYIDEIRISKVARYDGESYTPSQHFQVDGLTTGLWHLDDVSDETVCIDSSYNHNGDNSFGASYDPAGVGETPAD